jgi:hypothetical protein
MMPGIPRPVPGNPRVLPVGALLQALLCLGLGLGAGGCFLEGPPPPRPEHTLETLPAAAKHSPLAPGASTRVPAPKVVVAAAPAGETPSGTVAAPPALPHATGGTYLYGAKFEPPRGRILHGMGQWLDGNASYVRMLGDPAIMPASELHFAAVGDWPRPWDHRLEVFRQELAKDKAEGRFPHLDIGLFEIDSATRHEKGIDHIIATTDRYDSRIRDLALVLHDLGGPAFVRIGGEFSGEWSDYHAYEYPKAYRKIVQIFREEGADNCAFVWCYEPSCPDDFDVQDTRGPRWFPGDDVIDWFGLDIFETSEFAPGSGARSSANSVAKAARAERFLAMAREHGKPVILAECSPARQELTPDLEDGRRDWNEWFGPFIQFMHDHPEIEAFHYINYNWSKGGSLAESGWKDARIELNSYISKKWIAELHKPEYLHAPDVALLNGYAEASIPKPPKLPPVKPPAPPGAGGRGR